MVDTQHILYSSNIYTKYLETGKIQWKLQKGAKIDKIK